jgi:hypothetical protein
VACWATEERRGAQPGKGRRARVGVRYCSRVNSTRGGGGEEKQA